MKKAVYKLPDEFVERLREIFPPSQFVKLMHTFTEKRPTTFRVNTLKGERKTVIDSLKQDGLRLERIPWYEDAFILRNQGKKELMETPFYKESKIYIQTLSSMLPPLVLDPSPEDLLLDLAAAPGSKTTQMACLMQNKGKIVACDFVRDRFFKLLSNLKEQGVENAQTILGNGQTLWIKFKEHFNKVLLDSPCSTEGRFDVTNPKTFLFWKEKKIKEMVRKQKRLLYSGINALKVGGRLVYSTCTFAPEENEGVVNWALRKFSGKIYLEKIQLNIPNIIPGLLEWKGEKFLPEVRRSLRVLPTQDMEGFFICLLHKTESTLKTEPSPAIQSFS